MKRARFFRGTIILICASWGLLAARADETPATAPSATTAVAKRTDASLPTGRPAAVDKAEVTRLCRVGIEDALAGKYDKATRELADAAGMDPDEKVAREALELLKVQDARRRQSEAERTEEYAEVVRRVTYCRLTQEHLTALTEAKIDTKLREKVNELVQKYDKLGAADALEAAQDDRGEALKKDALQAVADARRMLPEIAAILKGDSSEYAKVFRGVVDTVARRLDEIEPVWKAADVATAKSRLAASRKLLDPQEGLAGALADLKLLTFEKPWQAALSEARVALELVPDQEKFRQEDWYRSLVKDAEERGEKCIRSADWYDALTAYGGLEEMDEANEAYKEKAKTVRRHVRVLRMYGQETPTTAPDRKSTTAPEDDEPAWQAQVSGVDAEMIRAAISRLHEGYVSTVDYRKVTRGALECIRILAETPQAARTFPSLGEEAKRQGFLEAIRREMEYVEKKDRVDQVDLTVALNNVIEASERTVQIPTNVLAVEFADGFLDELDRFSSMIWPNDVEDFRKQTMGQFYGVGIQITKDDGQPLRVVTPLPDTPAFKEGIKTNDLILEVDGRPTRDYSVDKLVRWITGEKGTQVTLKIKRSGVPSAFDVKLVREEINIRTVKGWRRLADGEWDYMIDPEGKIGYIRVTQFTDTTPTDIVKALESLKAAGMNSLVFDLRFNPGGLLRAATLVADEFLQAGRIVSTRGRQVRPTEVNARMLGSFLTGDLVVLINQHSASAAEIVSGALKDWRRGLIVGYRSFGKGSVQNVIPIRPDRAFLKLTTAYYYLPSGRLLHKTNGEKDWGVDPDVAIPVTPKQMRRWLEIHRKTELMGEVEEPELSDDLVKQYDMDLQLNTAVFLLKLRQMRESRPAA